MPYIFGMSLGSWILVIVIAIWIILAIKIYFFGGFKKRPKGQKASVGACCDTGDSPSTESSKKKDASKTNAVDPENCDGVCAGCTGCDNTATTNNAVMPTFRVDPKPQDSAH